MVSDHINIILVFLLFSALYHLHRYMWIPYINPNYYGFSAFTVFLLSDFKSDCEINGGSQLECYASSGQYVVDSLDFSGINPYQNIVVSTYPM